MRVWAGLAPLCIRCMPRHETISRGDPARGAVLPILGTYFCYLENTAARNEVVLAGRRRRNSASCSVTFVITAAERWTGCLDGQQLSIGAEREPVIVSEPTAAKESEG